MKFNTIDLITPDKILAVSKGFIRGGGVKGSQPPLDQENLRFSRGVSVPTDSLTSKMKSIFRLTVCLSNFFRNPKTNLPQILILGKTTGTFIA